MSELVITQKFDGLAVLRLNRPESYNALDLSLAKALSELVLELAGDRGVRGVVITGSGKAFCAGGDVKRAYSAPEGAGAAFHELATYVHLAVSEIRRMRKPVIAAVNGIAAGGGFSLALACDFRVMARAAILRQVFTSNGLCIDGGGTFALPRLVGLARSLEIAAFDKPITAEQALAWGLTTRVTEDGQELEEAVGMVRELAATSLNSFGWSKQLLNDSFDNRLEAQLETERVGIASCAEHHDGQEGMRAFIEKRKPVYWPEKPPTP